MKILKIEWCFEFNRNWKIKLKFEIHTDNYANMNRLVYEKMKHSLSFCQYSFEIGTCEIITSYAILWITRNFLGVDNSQ